MKINKVLLAVVLVLLTVNSFSQSNLGGSHVVVNTGVGLGSAIAVVASWDRNKSIMWAILHGILGWFYVVYYAITR